MGRLSYHFVYPIIRAKKSGLSSRWKEMYDIIWNLLYYNTIMFDCGLFYEPDNIKKKILRYKS